jgi:phospholipase/carboxylesterase
MTYLSQIQTLPPRRGQRPPMTPANPQEQLDQFPEDWSVIEELLAFAFSLEDVVEQATRIAPEGSRALTLPAPTNADRNAFLIDREFAHVHNPPVGSMHMTLPEPFRAVAIDKGWAVRHPFAITNRGTPDAVFVYAPRDREELQWAKLLLEISHAYARGTLAA